MASTRVRGFAPWQPRQETRATLDQVKQVLTQYRQLWPLTARQVFYRLVGVFDFPKTENAYKRLLEYLNRGRRAGLIPWGAIRDDGSTVVGSDRYEDAESFLSTVRDWASRAPMDLLQHQPIHLELFCEAAGMVPQLDRVARTYGVPVRSSGGFDSTTVKHDLAVIYSQIDKPVRVLHVGDLDPSGEHLHNALGEDLNAFMEQLGGRCTVRRVAAWLRLRVGLVARSGSARRGWARHGRARHGSARQGKEPLPSAGGELFTYSEILDGETNTHKRNNSNQTAAAFCLRELRGSHQEQRPQGPGLLGRLHPRLAAHRQEPILKQWLPSPIS